MSIWTHKGPTSRIGPMSVTTEDGGRLNAFAKEPRMEVMDVATSQSRNRSSMMMLVSGGLIVVAMVAVTVAIS